MKKLALVVGISALLSASVQADTLLGVYLGATVWDSKASGTLGENTGQVDFGLQDEQQGSYFIAVEHPLPLIPNIKIAKSTLDTTGGTTLTSSFEFGGETYPVGTSANAVFDVSYVDYTLYYEVFDNDLLSFDFGITGRDLDSNVNVTGDLVTGTLNANQIVPLLYASTNVGLPFTGFNLYAQGNFLSFDDHTFYDYEAGISYELVDNLAVDINLTFGYKALKLELEDLDDLYADLNFKGAFAGVVVHF